MSLGRRDLRKELRHPAILLHRRGRRAKGEAVADEKHVIRPHGQGGNGGEENQKCKPEGDHRVESFGSLQARITSSKKPPEERSK
jgi:hypothetical protein